MNLKRYLNLNLLIIILCIIPSNNKYLDIVKINSEWVMIIDLDGRNS